MATITISSVPHSVKLALLKKADKAGISLEEYVKSILIASTVDIDDPDTNIMDLAKLYFSNSDCGDLIDTIEIPPRTSSREI